MDRATLFAIGILLGWGLIALAFLLMARGRAAARRQRVLDRFAGERVVPVTLRREERWRVPFRLRNLALGLTPGTLGDLRREAGRPLLMIGAMSALVATLLLDRALPLGFLLCLPPGIVAGGAVVLMGLRIRRKRRETAIADRVPEFLEMMVRSLRVGLPVSRTIILAGEEIVGPLGEECREAAFQISYGKDVVTALRDLADRTRNRNLGFLATVVAIQQTSGGNLAEVLERLAQITRGHQQMQRKIAAATAEAQWSGRFLSAFPIIASGGMLLINPGFFSEISDKDFFPWLLATVGVMLVMNILYMRKMLRIDA